MNIYNQLICNLKAASKIENLEYEDFIIESSLRLAQFNNNIDKDAYILQLQTRLNQELNNNRILNLQVQNLSTELMNVQMGQGGYGSGYGSGTGPVIKPSENYVGSDIFFNSNDIARTVVQDGSNFKATVDQNENIPILINT